MATETAFGCPADELIGQSPCMRQLREQIAAIAASDVNLLLQGESGSGKEIVARTVHRLSGRRRGPFIGINCAAMHETLLESELFGHEAGAFTGAGQATVGFLRAAEGGTILLDEIGDMSSSLQAKLLRALEERAVVPVGGTRLIPVDIRIIAATHRDLAEAVEAGSFRQDLYYRLNVVCLSIPALRQRPDDVPLLADHMMRKMADVLQMPAREISPAAMAVLASYHWPGNVRELANVIQRGYVLGRGPVLRASDLPEQLLSGRRDDGGTAFPTLQDVMYRHVGKALKLSQGARAQAAQLLGITRKRLWRMLRRHEDLLP